jgi:hypothetical protein
LIRIQINFVFDSVFLKNLQGKDGGGKGMRKNPYGYLRVSELMAIIGDTIFNKETDKEIAIDIYVKAMTVERCASLLGYDWKTVQKRLPLIEDRINLTLNRQ